jgi:cellulose biosynthesis protein BcsQ
VVELWWLQVVVEGELLAITAIKDMEQEGFIAAALNRSGWKVVYRATSPELLLEKLDQFKDAVLVLSDDFIDVQRIQLSNTLLLRGRSHALGREGAPEPKSDFELGELIRNRSQDAMPAKVLIPATLSRVIAFTCVQGGVGATTLAINVADQLATSGKRVLLVDANSAAFSISEHFEVHDIRTQARELTETLSLFEVSEIAQLFHLGSIAHQYDYIVIDYGPLHKPFHGGNRVSDRTLQWIAHSQGELVITVGSSHKSVDRVGRAAKSLREFAPTLKVQVAITLDALLSRRERSQLIGEMAARASAPVAIFSRDRKAIAVCSQHASTLQRSTPKSIINREIGQYVRELLAR